MRVILEVLEEIRKEQQILCQRMECSRDLHILENSVVKMCGEPIDIVVTMMKEALKK